MSGPRVGVVVATRDRAESLDAALARLRALPERPPVVVVDNGSQDATAAVARAHGAIVVELGRNLGGAARNVGVRHLDCPVVAFADDDSWWAPGALARAAAAFEREPRLGLLAARVLVGPQERLDPVSAEQAAEDPAAGGRPVDGFLACGAVVRRSAFLAAGGFHPRLGIGGEEELLVLRLREQGWDLRYDGAVVAHHHPSGDGRDPSARRRVQRRNALWTRWLTAPPHEALRITGHATRDALRGPEAAGALIQAVAGLPWVLAERRAAQRPGGGPAHGGAALG